MSETVFYQDAGVSVTNARFVTAGQTHALSGITSVRRYSEGPNRLWPIMLTLMGFLAIAGAISNSEFLGIIVGGIMSFIGVQWFINQRATQHIIISTASGEIKALTDNDDARISKIVDALNGVLP